MDIAIMTPNFFVEAKEVHGQDRIIFGGAERYLVELCRLIHDLGHNVTVIQALSGKGFGSLAKKYKDIDFLLVETNDPWKYSVAPSFNMVFNELSGHADLRIYFATYAAYPYAKRPCISICHGIWWDYPHYTYNTCSKIEREEFMTRALYGFSAPDVCVSVDSNAKRVIQAIAPGAESNIEIIYNFVDTKTFAPAQKIKREKPKILFPRRLTTLRGCNEFMKASRDFPDYDYVAVGQSADQGAADHLKNSPTCSNITFTHVEMDGMEKVYQDADICVVPTRSTEGLSLSLLEGMASGLPMITTHAGGIIDGVINGYNALILDLAREDLGGAIDYLVRDTELAQKFAKRNREIAVECFDISLWRQKWANLIKQF